MKRRFLSFMTTAMIAATSWAQVPQADLLDVVFKTDGTAEDVSAMKNEVKAIGSPTVKQSLKYGMNTACLTNNVWGFMPQSYYRVDYEENQAFRDALKDGFTWEVLVRPVSKIVGIAPEQAAIFSTNEGGGGQIFVGNGSQSHQISFEANVGGKAQIVTSGIVPESGKYYHVVAVHNPAKSVMNIYIDGILAKKFDVDGTYKEAGEGNMWFAIGGDTQFEDQCARGFAGDIAMARIYSDPLSTEQAIALYNDVKAKDTGAEEHEDTPAGNDKFLMGENLHGLEMTQVEPYCYHFKTLNTDPYVNLSPLQEDLKDNETVIAFEYKTATDIPGAEFFFSPLAGGREMSFDLPAVEDWTMKYVNIEDQRKSFNWGKAGEFFRLDPGSVAEVELDVRNFHFITKEEYMEIIGGVELALEQDAEGWYLVSSSEDLVTLSEGVNSGLFREVKVRLTDHIDMSGIEGYVPIGVANSNELNHTGQPISNRGFAGEFDGQGFTISGLTATVNNAYATSGVFGTVTGTVRNLGVVGYYWENGYSGRHGALAGQLVEGLIENCYVVESHVVNTGEIVSSIAAGNYGGTIQNCFEYNNNINPYPRAGMLVGDNRDDNNVRPGKVINCYSQNFVTGEGRSGGYGGGKTNCQDHVSAEAFQNGEVTYKLNGSTFNPNGVWRQELGGDEYPVLDKEKPLVVVSLSGTNENISADGLADFISLLVDEESTFMDETVCQAEITERYAALIAELEKIETLEEFVPILEQMKTVRAEMQASAKAYAAYVAKIEEITLYMEENTNFGGAGRELVETYLTETVEPDSTQFPNGSYMYIMENLLLGNEALTQEAAFIQQLLDKAIATGYMAGADVTSMIVNANFANNNDGWTCNNALGFTNVGDAGITRVGESGTRLELNQTIKNLIPGFYELTVYAAYRADGFNQSYAQNSFIYAGENKVYTAALIEGMQPADPAPAHADKFEPVTDIEGNTIGYLPTNTSALAYAFGDGLYKHTLIAEVGEDSTLTIGISTPGCKAANQTWVGPFSMTYCGEMENELAVAAMDRMLECQAARLTTLSEKYPAFSTDNGNPNAAPNYSVATQAKVAETIGTISAATSAQEKMAKIKELGDLMQEVYDTKMAYTSMMTKAEVLQEISGEMFLAEMITEEEAAKMDESYNTITNAYLDGAYSLEEALNVNPFAGLSFMPVIENNVAQLGNAKELIMFSSLVNAGIGNTLDAVLTGDIDMAGITFYAPIGYGTPGKLNGGGGEITVPGYQGVFDGRGYSIKNLTASYNANYASSGVFGNNSGTIRNLIIDNYVFEFGDRAAYSGRHAAICGQNLPGGLIENCAIINSRVNHTGEIVSGVAAGNYGGVIRACFENKNFINPHSRAGMLVGDNRDDSNFRKGTVDFCFSGSFVTGDGRSGGYTGGITNSRNSVSAEVYATGEIAYILNQANEGHPECMEWRQTIGEDASPVLDQSRMKVLFIEGDYTNYDGVNNELRMAMLTARDLLAPVMQKSGKPMIYDTNQFSTNCQWGNEGGLEHLLDGSTATFFHSDASGDGQNQFRAGTQYLQVALDKQIKGFYMEYSGRGDGAPEKFWHDTPNKIRILATNTPDDEASWAEICVVEYPEIPNQNNAYFKNTEPIMLGGSYQHIRFNMLQATSGYAYWNVSEFQLYTADEGISYYDEHPELQAAADALTALCDAAAEKIASLSATEQDVADMKAAITALRKLVPGSMVPFAGTQDDPILIATAEDMEDLRKQLVAGKKTYVQLLNDIDMAEVEDWTPLNVAANTANGREFQNFIDFDGCGHVIRNFSCTVPGQPYNSFFGILCGDVRNVGFENANVTADVSGTGILAANMGHDMYIGNDAKKITSTLYNVWVTGKLNVASGYAGGLVGNIGGPAYIKNCYTNVEITSDAETTGGLVGRVRDELTILQAYAAGTMNKGGGIVGGGQTTYTPASTYNNVVVWNNTDNNFGATVDAAPDLTSALPSADLMDIVFNEDGSAKDVSPMQHTVQTYGAPTVVYSDKYGRNIATMKAEMGEAPTDCYMVNYAGNEAFKNALTDGFSMETTFAIEYDKVGGIAKMFSAMASGGFGFEINGGNLRYQVHNGGYVSAISGITPISKVFYHVVGVYDKTAEMLYIYLNGVLLKKSQMTGDMKFPANEIDHWIGIGADTGAKDGVPAPEGGGNWEIVNARMYNEPLTQDNVSALYAQVENMQGAADTKTGISFYDGSNFAALQSTVVGWGAPWQCDMAEGSYPTFDMTTAIEKITSDPVLKSDIVTVYTTNGQVVYSGKAGGMNLKPGIYVIKGDGRTYKMAIK